MTNKDTGAVTESILIGRATGNVGAELVKQLAAPGKRVKGSRKEQVQGCQHQVFAQPVFGDLMTPAALEPAFKNVERAFVLAPRVAKLRRRWREMPSTPLLKLA